MGQVEVSLGDRAYTVHVECGAIDQCGALLANAVSGRRVLVIADANITHAEAVCASLIKAGFDAPMVRVEASERKGDMFSHCGNSRDIRSRCFWNHLCSFGRPVRGPEFSPSRFIWQEKQPMIDPSELDWVI